MEIIIPVAGQGKRMKSYGPKCLISVGPEQNILSRQLNIIGELFPDADITIIVGFQQEKVLRFIPYNAQIIFNEEHETTNVAHSLGLAFEARRSNEVLIVYGDLVFSRNLLENLDFSKSFVLVDNEKQMDEREVGVVVCNSEICNFSYGLSTKWAQVAYLKNNEAEVFAMESKDRRRRKQFGFEILNDVIEQGRLVAVERPEAKLIDVDCLRDIYEIGRVIK